MLAEGLLGRTGLGGLTTGLDAGQTLVDFGSRTLLLQDVGQGADAGVEGLGSLLQAGERLVGGVEVVLLGQRDGRVAGLVTLSAQTVKYGNGHGGLLSPSVGIVTTGTAGAVRWGRKPRGVLD